MIAKKGVQSVVSRSVCSSTIYFGLGGFMLLITAAAESNADPLWNAHYQATYIEQQKQAFDAAYSGPNSLSTERENSYSFTATAFLGVRPWADGELYLNPEVSRGVALSNLTGLGGFTNGEMARTSSPSFKLYRARLYLRQTWNLGGDPQQIEDGPNQLPQVVSRQRVVVTLGNLSLLDVFDSNHYSHDPRTGFLNWALITYGAYDFAADARGYTWAAIAELDNDDWVVRGGRGLLPQQPNGAALDTRLLQHYGDQLEIEHDHQWRNLAGAIHLLGFHDRAVLARYRDAQALASATNSTPDINAVRSVEQNKYGVGLSFEQAISESSGVFARVMWADGQTETEAYASIDRSIATGIVIDGRAWHRAQDNLGIAYALNALSAADRSYLAAGGEEFFMGDGRLNYGDERIVEAYYNLQASRGAWLTANLQHITNPAYNRDRGPVAVIALRAHLEF